MDGSLDWDLLAVVRSCSSTTTTTTTVTTTTTPPSAAPPPPPLLQQQEQFCFSSSTPSTSSSNSVHFGFSSPSTSTSFLCGDQQELQDICNPLICTTSATTCNNYNINNTNNYQSLSSSSLTSSVSPASSSLITAVGRSFTVSQLTFEGSSSTVTNTSSGGASLSQRTKKRKNLMKKVCHVPAEALSSDMWAWRKYGQKPIKGSPYPRGYYRCSSSKGCLARKQVERNRTDPKMFIVSYTSDHNHPMPTHRNTLAGSTRQKPPTTTGTPPEQPTKKSKSTTEGEDNDMEGISDLMLNDDSYVGFEQIDGGSDDSDCFSEHFSPSSEFLWLDNGSTTATGEV